MKKALFAAAALAALAAGIALALDPPVRSGRYRTATAATDLAAGDIAGLNSTGCVQRAVGPYAVAMTNCLGRVESPAKAGEPAVILGGCFRLPNIGGVTDANIGSAAYWVYTATSNGVSKAAGTTSVKLGVIQDVDADGVWVAIGL